ncbi:TasA family protein [Sporosarcina koreensis]|uniref:TasA family protein n=1 Tax=Sporosarcina koreensis TaxID=334735 RepID=A0ABW0U0G4_9BACL
MNIKKKLAMSIATGALAVSMIGGGTYAYFNTVQSNTSSFAAGEMGIAITGNNTENAIINVSNIKPGDYMNRHFTLTNKGTLDISKVLLSTTYDESVGGFGDHIKVDFYEGTSATETPYLSKTLRELRDTPNLDFRSGKIEVDKNKTIIVKFTFVDNGDDQNIYQKASLKLNWAFNAQQTAGQSK